MEITEPEKVWVSDITYIGKREKPCYLSLITDLYSKKIVGFDVSDSLATEGTVRALKWRKRIESIKQSSYSSFRQRIAILFG